MSVDRLPASPNIRLLCFDLDGTLLEGNRIDSEVLNEIKRVREMGIQIAFATGRPRFCCVSLAKQVGVNAVSSYCAGSLLYDELGDRVECSWSMNAELLLPLLLEAQERQLAFEVYDSQHYFTEILRKPTQIHAEVFLQVMPSEEKLEKSLSERAIVKVTAPVLSADDNGWNTWKSLFAKHPHFQVSEALGGDGTPLNFFNITASDACRTQSFSLLASTMNVAPEQIAAFGDSDQDREFVEAAGIGVAMGNGTDALKNAADYVIASVSEAGVAHALRQLFPENYRAC